MIPVQAVEVVRSRLADTKEAVVAGQSSDKPAPSDRGRRGKRARRPNGLDDSENPRRGRRTAPKTQLEFWAFLLGNTGNTIRLIALCIGVGLAVAVPFAVLALVFTLLHLQLAVPTAIYGGVAAMFGGLGVAIGLVRKGRSNSGADSGGGDDAPPGGESSDDLA